MYGIAAVILIVTITEAEGSFIWVELFSINILGYPAAVAMTMTTIYFEDIFYFCCQCWNSAGEYVGVFDPEHPDKEFKLENGEVVEVTNQ